MYFAKIKDWLLYGEGLGAGERDSQDTDQLAGLTWAVPLVTRNIEKLVAGILVVLALVLKYYCCTLRFLKYISNVNFILHVFPSVCRSLKCMHM